jgi:hypothetical protein
MDLTDFHRKLVTDFNKKTQPNQPNQPNLWSFTLKEKKKKIEGRFKIQKGKYACFSVTPLADSNTTDQLTGFKLDSERVEEEYKWMLGEWRKEGGVWTHKDGKLSPSNMSPEKNEAVTPAAGHTVLFPISAVYVSGDVVVAVDIANAESYFKNGKKIDTYVSSADQQFTKYKAIGDHTQHNKPETADAADQEIAYVYMFDGGRFTATMNAQRKVVKVYDDTGKEVNENLDLTGLTYTEFAKQDGTVQLGGGARSLLHRQRVRVARRRAG